MKPLDKRISLPPRIRRCKCGMPLMGAMPPPTEGIQISWRPWHGPPIISKSPRARGMGLFKCGKLRRVRGVPTAREGCASGSNNHETCVQANQVPRSLSEAGIRMSNIDGMRGPFTILPLLITKSELPSELSAPPYIFVV